MFNWFITTDRRTATLKARITQLEEDRDRIIDDNARLKTSLAAELTDAKDKLSDLKREHKHSEEDVAHLVKIKESKLDLAYDKKVIELERTSASQVASVKDTYRDKLENHLKGETTRITEMYGQILERLPNVSLAIKQQT